MAYKAVNVDELLNIMRSNQGSKSQLEYSNSLNVSPQYVCDIFSGTRSPGKKILNSLGVIRETIYYVPEQLLNGDSNGKEKSSEEIGKERKQKRTRKSNPR